MMARKSQSTAGAVSDGFFRDTATNDPREMIKRLSWQIASLMDEVDEYDMISIQAQGRQAKPIHTYFNV